MKYGYYGWEDGEDCNEPDKHFLVICTLDDAGNADDEIAVIVCRDYQKTLQENPALIKQKEDHAKMIVACLNFRLAVQELS